MKTGLILGRTAFPADSIKKGYRVFEFVDENHNNIEYAKVCFNISMEHFYQKPSGTK